MKNYTIKELADKFSVTEMAIHKQLKHDKVKDFVIYENNRKYLTEDGFKALESLRNDNQKYSSKAKETLTTEKAIKVTDDTVDAESRPYSYFSDSTSTGADNILYKQLVKQLEIKDSQINELTSLLGKQTEQVNLLTHTIKNMNGTLQLKEVSSITSDMTLNKDRDEDEEIENKNNIYTTFTPYQDEEVEKDMEDIAASDVEELSIEESTEPVIEPVEQEKRESIEELLQKAKQMESAMAAEADPTKIEDSIENLVKNVPSTIDNSFAENPEIAANPIVTNEDLESRLEKARMELESIISQGNAATASSIATKPARTVETQEVVEDDEEESDTLDATIRFSNKDLQEKIVQDDEDKEEASVDNEDDDDAEEDDSIFSDDDEYEDDDEPIKKKGFFGKLFSKK